MSIETFAMLVPVVAFCIILGVIIRAVVSNKTSSGENANTPLVQVTDPHHTIDDIPGDTSPLERDFLPHGIYHPNHDLSLTKP